MARASHVYVPTDVSGPEFKVLATFTVKHECQAWLRGHCEADTGVALCDVNVARYPDGHYSASPTWISAERFLS